MWQKLERFPLSKLLNVLTLGVMVAAIPFTVLLAQREQNINQQAAEISTVANNKGVTTFGKAIMLTNQNSSDQQYVRVLNPTALAHPDSVKTIEGWFRATSLRSAPQTDTLLDLSGTTGTAWKADIAQDKLHYRGFSGTKFVSSYCEVLGQTPIQLNQWQHFAIVKENSTIKLFLNGTADGKTSCVEKTKEGIFDLGIGDSPTPTTENNGLNGMLDDIRISSIPRYLAPFLPPSAPFITGANDGNILAYYTFGGDATDNSMNKYTGTLVGNVIFTDSTIPR